MPIAADLVFAVASYPFVGVDITLAPLVKETSGIMSYRQIDVPVAEAIVFKHGLLNSAENAVADKVYSSLHVPLIRVVDSVNVVIGYNRIEGGKAILHRESTANERLFLLDFYRTIWTKQSIMDVVIDVVPNR